MSFRGSIRFYHSIIFSFHQKMFLIRLVHPRIIKYSFKTFLGWFEKSLKNIMRVCEIRCLCKNWLLCNYNCYEASCFFVFSGFLIEKTCHLWYFGAENINFSVISDGKGEISPGNEILMNKSSVFLLFFFNDWTKNMSFVVFWIREWIFYYDFGLKSCKIPPQRWDFNKYNLCFWWC